MTHLRIKELAEAQGLNITTLARKAELSYTTAHALWHDTAKQWNRDTLNSVARVLGCRVSDLIAGEPGEPKSGNWEPALIAA